MRKRACTDRALSLPNWNVVFSQPERIPNADATRCYGCTSSPRGYPCLPRLSIYARWILRSRGYLNEKALLHIHLITRARLNALWIDMENRDVPGLARLRLSELL